MQNRTIKDQSKEKRTITHEEEIEQTYFQIKNSQSSVYGFSGDKSPLSVEGIYEKLKFSEIFRGAKYPELEEFLTSIGHRKHLRQVMMKVKIAEVMHNRGLQPERGIENAYDMGRKIITECVVQFLHFKRNISAEQIGILLNESQLRVLNEIDKMKESNFKNKSLTGSIRVEKKFAYNENLPISKEEREKIEELLIEGKSHIAIAMELNVSRATVANISGWMHDKKMADMMRNKKGSPKESELAFVFKTPKSVPKI